MRYNEEQIIEEYLNGTTAQKIAKDLGTYNTTIRRILLRNNVTLRNQSESHRQVANPFENLNSKEVNYWLGILASDGTIGDKEYIVSLELQEKDIELLKKFARFVGIFKIQAIKYKTSTCYRVGFKSKECNLFLRNLGITPIKSKTLKCNFAFTSDFIRGVIDGDGYIRKNKGHIEIATQSSEFKDQLVKWFELYNIIAKPRFTNNLWIVGIYKKEYLFKLYYILYEDASVKLERKFNRLYASLFGNI